MANSIELTTFDWRRRHVTEADRLSDCCVCVCVCACACDVNQQLARKSSLGGSGKKKMCACGRQFRSRKEASFVTSVAFPQPLRPGLRRVRTRMCGSHELTPTRIMGTLTLPAYIIKPGSGRKKDCSPSLSLELLPISFQTEEDERFAVTLRSLSAPAHSGAIVRDGEWVEWRYTASCKGMRWLGF